ncbi:hypothetical protein CsSME_00051518 [Camellia sinensis var. sinensis]
MTIVAEISSHGRSPKEDDHLARSTKKIKGDQTEQIDASMGEQSSTLQLLHSDSSDPDLTKATVQQHPNTETMEVNEEKGRDGDGATAKSFKQTLLHSRFNENNNENNFDCDVAEISSDDEEDMIEDLGVNDPESGQNDLIP